jgi:hypothetical protein
MIKPFGTDTTTSNLKIEAMRILGYNAQWIKEEFEIVRKQAGL